MAEHDYWVAGEAGPIPVTEWRAAQPGPVAMLVHGATYSGRTAFGFARPGDNSLATALAAVGITAVTFAIRGYGGSAPAVDGLSVTTEAALADLERVANWLSEERGHARTHLLGWSWGGRIAAYWAASRPDRVGRLVLYGGALFGGGGLERPESPFRENDEASVLARLEPEFTEPSVRTAFAMYVAAHEPRSPNGVFVELANGSPPINPEAIACPTMLVYGAADRLYQPAAVAEFFARLPTDDKALVVVPGAGHFLHLQRPRFRLFALVADFLRAETEMR